MPRIAILSDTHVPARAPEIPAWVTAEIEAADHVIHAGDFVATAILERVESLTDGELTAVSGNMDPAGLSLAGTAVRKIGGRTFVVTHGTGSPAGYEERVRDTARRATDADRPIAVSGHTHQVLDSEGEIRILNPGSATGAPPASETTMMRADVSDGDVSVEVLRG